MFDIIKPLKKTSQDIVHLMKLMFDIYEIPKH